MCVYIYINRGLHPLRVAICFPYLAITCNHEYLGVFSYSKVPVAPRLWPSKVSGPACSECLLKRPVRAKPWASNAAYRQQKPMEIDSEIEWFEHNGQPALPQPVAQPDKWEELGQNLKAVASSCWLQGTIAPREQAVLSFATFHSVHIPWKDTCGYIHVRCQTRQSSKSNK